MIGIFAAATIKRRSQPRLKCIGTAAGSSSGIFIAFVTALFAPSSVGNLNTATTPRKIGDRVVVSKNIP
jgi:hypothetical protein